MPHKHPGKTQRPPALFGLAFRPFFLGGAVISILALLLWGSFWFYGPSWAPYGGWFWWHGHEMIFGFVCAIIAGFLLTAVKNWTGQDSLQGWPLAALFLLWLLPRVLMLLPGAAWQILVPWLDLAFLPLVAWVLSRLVWRVRQFHNLVFTPVLLLLTLCNAQMHWAVASGDMLLAKQAGQGAIFLILLVMLVLGGRVIPFFTASGTATPQIRPRPTLEFLSIASVALLTLMQIAGLLMRLPAALSAGLFVLAALANLLRWLAWRPWISLREPLLWSLHGAYLFILLGLFLCAAFFSGLEALSPHYATILHSFTLGGMGLLILAMMSRVSLGHTGRELKVGRWLSLGFASLAAAYFCRGWLPLLWPAASHAFSYLLPIALWIVGYGLFVMIYTPILCRARVDGRPG